jgi:hypothetical protein
MTALSQRLYSPRSIAHPVAAILFHHSQVLGTRIPKLYLNFYYDQRFWMRFGDSVWLGPVTKNKTSVLGPNRVREVLRLSRTQASL